MQSLICYKVVNIHGHAENPSFVSNSLTELGGVFDQNSEEVECIQGNMARNLITIQNSPLGINHVHFR